MAIKAYKGVAPEWYTPESEKGFDDAAQFEVRGLTGSELLDVQSHFDLENTTIRGPGLVLACKYGLTDWKNIVDDKGEEVVFVKRTALDRLPAEVLAELGSHIISSSVMDEDETGN